MVLAIDAAVVQGQCQFRNAHLLKEQETKGTHEARTEWDICVGRKGMCVCGCRGEKEYEEAENRVALCFIVEKYANGERRSDAAVANE